jgi:hypothetical protein
MGTVASGHPQGDHQAARDRSRGQGHTGRHPPGSLALPAPGNRRPERSSASLCLTRPPGLLEPYAATSGTYGSEGPRCSNASGLPDRAKPSAANSCGRWPAMPSGRAPTPLRRDAGLPELPPGRSVHAVRSGQ